MMKAGGMVIQQQPPPLMEENMSNLTCASGEAASVSSGNRSAENKYQQSYASPPPLPAKKKRNLPGNPDPDAEVIALSPKTLMATNRFVCEICNKGFQRDQNLQLHRRGHNLPWKLRQRTSKEVRKRVYICPEPSCVHHDPSRALGDLTGIKKHFCRKHGEKKWKCDKCSKRYAVQSDWKAHSKTCGTREYRCDCGTLFSRRDSFITHRAFCDALAEESARAITVINPALTAASPSRLPSSSQSQATASNIITSNLSAPAHFPHHHIFRSSNTHQRGHHDQQQTQLIMNLQRPTSADQIPPWLACPAPPPVQSTTASSLMTNNLDGHLPSSIFSAATARMDQDFSHSSFPGHAAARVDGGNNINNFHSAAPHMSATALLQKAAQMGATMSKPYASSPSPVMRTAGGHSHINMTAAAEASMASPSTSSTTTTTLTGFGLNLISSRDQDEMESARFVQGLTTAFATNKAAAGFQLDHAQVQQQQVTGTATTTPPPPHPSLLQNMMSCSSLPPPGTGFDHGPNFDDQEAASFGSGILLGTTTTSSKRSEGNGAMLAKAHHHHHHHHHHHQRSEEGGGGGGGGGNDGLTRDFLGLRAFSHRDILNMAGLGDPCNINSSSSYHEHTTTHNQKPWQG
ncbi:hypothetical protein H6P81_000134 [Aristolochia fimbriata]|uniref:C2H2-type domain-containing protein n=1 Tax=Aristolochia fimbriata TaxID=158543 RepID=A0AAV7F711_ARIFI|nr:hypothetical protein H6P81_000134 [Aristolochia fimbriata]